MGELWSLDSCCEAVVSQPICFQFIFPVHLWFNWLLPQEPFSYSKSYYSPDSHTKIPHHDRITSSDATICPWLQIGGFVFEHSAPLYHPDDSAISCIFAELLSSLQPHSARLRYFTAMRHTHLHTAVLQHILSHKCKPKQMHLDVHAN